MSRELMRQMRQIVSIELRQKVEVDYFDQTGEMHLRFQDEDPQDFRTIKVPVGYRTVTPDPKNNPHETIKVQTFDRDEGVKLMLEALRPEPEPAPKPRAKPGPKPKATKEVETQAADAA